MFSHSCLPHASVHRRPLSMQGHLPWTQFLEHVQNINSNTSSGAGFIVFHLMETDSFSPNSQPFPVVDGMSRFAIKQFLQTNVWYAALLEWRCKLSRQGGIECTSNFPCLEEYNLYLKRLTSLPLRFCPSLPYPREVENIFFEILLPNSKPITVGTIYRPPSQSNFLEVLNDNMNKIDSINNETYIFGDFNINLYLNNSYILARKNFLNNKSVPSDVKSYHELCTYFGLKQLIKVPTRVTSSSSTIIDHILASFPERVTQSGVIDIGLSDHQLIYCTRKISRIKRGSHKQTKFRSFKHYTVDLFEQELSKLNFPNY